MQARKYQQQAIDFSVAAISSGKRALIQLPTGTGKSLVLLAIAKYAVQHKRPAYIIAPTEEAVMQLRSLALRLGLLPALDTTGNKVSRFSPLIITTYACAWRRYKKRLTNNTLCILDECHHVNFNAPVNLDILNSFQAAIGLSATPWSKGCYNYFDKNRFRYKLSEAIADGFNCPYKIEPWREPTKGDYQIIYTNNGRYRSELCSNIPGSDYAIYQRSNARAIIAKFRYGRIGTIVVNRMLTEGFDLPQIKHVWIARTTKSKIAAMQMAGRALRPCSGKVASIYPLDQPTALLLQHAIKKAE